MIVQMINDKSTELYPNIQAENIPSGAVGTEKLADKGVTKAKLAAALQTEIDAKATTTALNTTNNNVTALSARMDRVEASEPVYCGRYWNLANSTPKAAGYVGNLSMLQQLPDLLKLGGYLVKDDHSRKKLSASTHYQYEDGTTAKLDGSEGHYQAGWGVKWYFKPEYDEFNKIMSLKISLTPQVGWYAVPVGSDSASGWAAVDRTNLKLVSYCNTDVQYRGGNNTASYDGAYNSLLGKAASSITTANFMAYAKKNGDGWLCSTGRMTCAWAVLFFVIMGTLKVDEAVNTSLDANGLRQGGLGSCPFFDWSKWTSHNGNNPFIPMDAGADKGDYVGTIATTFTLSDGTSQTWNMPCFFGFKNFYDYLWRQCCDEFLDCNSDGSQTHYQVLEPYYKDFTFGTVDDTVRKGSTGPAATAANWSYITRVAFAHFELMPLAVGGSSTTRFSDGYYNPASTSGFPLCLRAATANSGDSGGWCCLSGGFGLSAAGAYLGSSLSEVTEEFKITPLTEADVAA